MGIQLQEQPESNMHTIIIDIFIRSTRDIFSPGIIIGI
jgi:hypothetical protein